MPIVFREDTNNLKKLVKGKCASFFIFKVKVSMLGM
jgi:hypothetical protein